MWNVKKRPTPIVVSRQRTEETNCCKFTARVILMKLSSSTTGLHSLGNILQPWKLLHNFLNSQSSGIFALLSELQAIKATGIRYELWLERENAEKLEAAEWARASTGIFILSAGVITFEQHFPLMNSKDKSWKRQVTMVSRFTLSMQRYLITSRSSFPLRFVHFIRNPLNHDTKIHCSENARRVSNVMQSNWLRNELFTIFPRWLL